MYAHAKPGTFFGTMDGPTMAAYLQERGFFGEQLLIMPRGGACVHGCGKAPQPFRPFVRSAPTKPLPRLSCITPKTIYSYNVGAKTVGACSPANT